MNNPPCICVDIFSEAAMGRMDRETWMVEYEQYVLEGHVASCHHRSSEADGEADVTAPREHRIFARILNDMMLLTPAERFGRI